MFDKSTISNIVNRITTKINPDKIFLFGSYANNQANENSDIDLLIIKDTSEPKYKRSIEIQRLLIGSKIPVDIVVYTNDELKKDLEKIGYEIYGIEKSTKNLYSIIGVTLPISLEEDKFKKWIKKMN